jgi:hypothetical protein
MTNGQEKIATIGVNGSIDYLNVDFKPITGFNHKYEMNQSFSFGLRFQYNISERLSLRSGMTYSVKGYKLNYKFILMDSGDPVIPRESKLNIAYLGIPVMAGYSIINNERFKLSPSFGLINEILISNNETSIFEDNKEGESQFLNQNLNKFLLSVQINLGLEYHIGKKIFFGLEPYLRYGFNKFDNEIMISNPVTYGGVLSINYKLLK